MNGQDPAFPSWESWTTVDDLGREREVHGTSGGMTLRDYFAAQALNGFFASQAWMSGMDKKAIEAGATMADAMAQLAYQYADAMLAAREKGPTK